MRTLQQVKRDRKSPSIRACYFSSKFGMQEDASISQLWKYFPIFRSDLTFTDDNVYVGNSATEEFAYYLVHSIAVDLQRGRDGEERETGFWVRNQNFLVKSADFLERGGPGRKIKPLHEPLKPWVFGEIFHKDMNRFLTVSRNDFLFNKTEFREFHKWKPYLWEIRLSGSERGRSTTGIWKR